eukprot:TRINITY_DN507_c0_g1_i1.p1 TRINITY_DN507_c0_g1~~TRINITY_DN507_c0_g1_i1.p1  ORF type:complete len:851 (+),score=192.02 TRINITY_DN507_c0_g1_i1:101-2653(+)
MQSPADNGLDRADGECTVQAEVRALRHSVEKMAATLASLEKRLGASLSKSDSQPSVVPSQAPREMYRGLRVDAPSSAHPGVESPSTPQHDVLSMAGSVCTNVTARPRPFRSARDREARRHRALATFDAGQRDPTSPKSQRSTTIPSLGSMLGSSMLGPPGRVTPNVNPLTPVSRNHPKPPEEVRGTTPQPSVYAGSISLSHEALHELDGEAAPRFRTDEKCRVDAEDGSEAAASTASRSSDSRAAPSAAAARFGTMRKMINPVAALKGRTRGEQRKSLSAAFHDRTNPLAGSRDEAAAAAATPETVYHPNTKRRIVVDVLVYISVLVETLAALYTFVTCETPPLAYTVLVAAAQPIFPLWIWHNARTIIVEGWTLIEDPRHIRTRYLRGWFPCDLVLAVPWDLLLSLAHPLAFRLGVLVRALKAFMVRRLFRGATLIHDEPLWVRVFVNGFYLIFVAHTCACSWMMVASPDERHAGNFDDQRSRFREYMASLYWALATLTSTGYGDISASSTPEARALSLFWMCFGVLVIIYTGAKLTDLMVVTDPFALAEIDKKRKLSAFLSKNNIPWNVQKSALRVFPVVLEMTCQDNSSIIEELPQFLQEEIRVHVKQKLISRVPLFHGLSEEVMRALVQVTVPEEYQVEDNIVEHGDHADEMFFLEHGLVEVFTFDDVGKESWIANLKSGSHFGESALMSDCCRAATVRAVTKCSVYTLPKESFEYIASLYEELHRKVKAEKKARLKQQGKFGSTMFRKSVALNLFCTPRVTDTAAKVRWKHAMRCILEGRYERKLAELEAGACVPTPHAPHAGVTQDTFFERVHPTPDEVPLLDPRKCPDDYSLGEPSEHAAISR